MNLPIENDKYQVFLLTCPAIIPVAFASHPWFVVNKQGSVARWEVDMTPESAERNWGYIQYNSLPSPTLGISVFPYTGIVRWPEATIRLHGYISGGEGSLAHRMIQFIETAPERYPRSNHYSLLGPNSNTFAQWVLDYFPEVHGEMQLPWNAYGKSCL